MNAALPSSFKLANETYIVIHPEWDEDTSKLNDAEYLIIEGASTSEAFKDPEIAQIIQRKTVLPFIKKMQELKLVEIEDEVFERYRPKIRKMMCLSPGLNSETAIALLKTSPFAKTRRIFGQFF